MADLTQVIDRMAARYQRRYVISRHALDRFRERVDEEFLSRSDMELGNMLDEKLRHAEERYTVKDPRAPGATTHLYPLYTRRSGTFYAVVRDTTAVTVLDADMARNNFGDVWGGVPAPIAKGAARLNTPFAQLRAVVPAPPASPALPALPASPASLASPASPAPPAPPAPLATASAPPAPPAPRKAQELHMPNMPSNDAVSAAGAQYALALKEQRIAALALIQAREAMAAATRELEAATDRASAASERVAKANQDLLRITGAD